MPTFLQKNVFAFTLVEITLVLGVVSVVVAIAVASLNSFKSDSQSQKMKANIVSIEQAKNRYMLVTEEEILGQDVVLEDIAPYLSKEGTPVSSIFDLVEGTGKTTNDLDLGSYGVRPANYKDVTSASVSSSGGFPFNPADPSEAAAALQTLAGMSLDDPNYESYVAGLNKALELGTIYGEGLEAAGLVNLGDQWVSENTNQALAILDGGGSWEDLSPQQRAGYSNSLPSEAIALGGADALNSITQGLLTPELVDGYVNNTGTWEAPYQNSSFVDDNSFPYTSPSWSGWNKQHPIAVITNPLTPAVIVGFLVPQYSPTMWMGMGPPPDVIGGKYYTVGISPNDFNLSISNQNSGITAGSYTDPWGEGDPTVYYTWEQSAWTGEPEMSVANMLISTPAGYPVKILSPSN